MSIGKSFAKAALLTATAMTAPAMAGDVQIPNVQDMTYKAYAGASMKTQFFFMSDTMAEYSAKLENTDLDRAHCIIGRGDEKTIMRNYKTVYKGVRDNPPSSLSTSMKKTIREEVDKICPATPGAKTLALPTQ